jgi:protein associated with RNAse G/E
MRYCHKWYNVWHICEQVSYTNRMYINIAMPVALHDKQLVWIDLDLDYRVHMDGSIERLDQVEFDINVEHMGYHPQVIAQAQAACHEVEAGLFHGLFPFDYEQQIKLYNQIKTGLCNGSVDQY